LLHGLISRVIVPFSPFINHVTLFDDFVLDFAKMREDVVKQAIYYQQSKSGVRKTATVILDYGGELYVSHAVIHIK
jgi:hypothetical protein